MNQISLRSFFVLTFLVFLGCGSVEENRERLLEKIIEENASLKKNAIDENNGVVSDLIVSRDGDEDGVVFEFVYAKGYVVDENQLTEESLRSLAVAKLNSSPQTKKILDSGIYYKMVYKSHSGKLLGEVKITSEDFE